MKRMMARDAASMGAALMGAAMLGAISSAGANAADGAAMFGRESCETCIFAEAEALYLHRLNSESEIRWLGVNRPGDPLGQPGDDILVEDTGSFHFQWQPGARVTLGKYFSPRIGAEVSGFLVGRYDATLSFADPGNLTLPFQSAYPGIANSDFANADAVSATARSKIGGAEINFLYRFRDNVGVLVGLRWVDLSEDFVIASTRGVRTSNYAIATSNALYGVQVGFDTRLPLTERWAIGAEGKVGAMLSDASQRQTIADNNNAVPYRNSEMSALQPAFVGDGSVFVKFALAKSIVASLKLEVLALSGIASAQEQLDFQTGDFFTLGGTGDDTKIVQDGFVLYNGISFSVKVRL